MVKTPDELFELWINEEMLPGMSRKDFCDKADIPVKDVKWGFYGGVSYSSFNRFANDVQ